MTIYRQEYLECARIRAERCPLYAEQNINIAEADNTLPENGIPPGIMPGAVCNILHPISADQPLTKRPSALTMMRTVRILQKMISTKRIFKKIAILGAEKHQTH